MWFEWLWYSCYFSSSLHVGWFAHRYTICSAAMAQLLSNASQKLDEVIPRHRLALILAVKMACNLSDSEWLWLNSSHFYLKTASRVFDWDLGFELLSLLPPMVPRQLVSPLIEPLASWIFKSCWKSRFLLDWSHWIPTSILQSLVFWLQSLAGFGRLWTDSWLDDIGAGRKSLSFEVWLPHLEFLRSLVGFWPAKQQSTGGRVFMPCSWWAANLNLNFAGFKYFLRMCLKLLDETIKPNETKDLKSNCWFSQCFCTV